MNWGWRITIFLTCFIAFILSMVVYSFYTTNDLVAEDYYNQEIHYQMNIDAQKNALELSKEVQLTSETEVVKIQFPNDFNINYTDGEISFYRPDDAKLDQKFSLKLSDSNTQTFDKRTYSRKCF